MNRLEQVQHSFSLLRAFKERAFFNPAFIDYRGRMYYYGGFIQPQAINMVRAHIESTTIAEVPSKAWAYMMLFAMNDVGVKGTIGDKIIDSLTWVEQAGQLSGMMETEVEGFGKLMEQPSENEFEFVSTLVEVAGELG